MSAQPTNTRYAYWVGYQLSLDDFKNLVVSIPQTKARLAANKEIIYNDYFCAYLKWRRSLPKEQRKNVLRVLYRFKPDAPSDGKTEQTATHIVFCIRFVDYTGTKQVEDPKNPDYTVIRSERKEDKQKLDSFVELVKQCGGKPDVKKFGFTYMKELHPTTDWRNGLHSSEGVEYTWSALREELDAASKGGTS
ncbi:hypothetical protein BC835DRAFT_1419502 [Cytidiella melzeri]|nr:hypothetical protein BC835DRAFT_1419502 [Cytidiella melzeri]